jgi:hypothetical protein
MTASAAITPGGSSSVFTQVSFTGSPGVNDYVDAESRATLEEQVWFTGGNPNDIFSFAVSGLFHFTEFKNPPPFGTAQSFVHLELGTVYGGLDHTAVSNSYGAPDQTFNLAMQANPYFLNPPEAFFFRLQSESIVVGGIGGNWDLLASSLVDAFVTFYDEAGNDITGNYTLTYIPGSAVVTTPEPATFTTMLTGLLGVVGFVSRRRRALQILS